MIPKNKPLTCSVDRLALGMWVYTVGGYIWRKQDVQLRKADDGIDKTDVESEMNVIDSMTESTRTSGEGHTWVIVVFLICTHIRGIGRISLVHVRLVHVGRRDRRLRLKGTVGRRSHSHNATLLECRGLASILLRGHHLPVRWNTGGTTEVTPGSTHFGGTETKRIERVSRRRVGLCLVLGLTPVVGFTVRGLHRMLGRASLRILTTHLQGCHHRCQSLVI